MADIKYHRIIRCESVGEVEQVDTNNRRREMADMTAEYEAHAYPNAVPTGRQAEPPEEHRRIVGLRVENFKGIRLVDLVPDPHLNVVGGNNASGKSSLLDSIPTALLGARWGPKEKIRKDEDKGVIVLDLGGGVKVRWSKTESGRANVTVTDKKGSTQDFLDALTGSSLGYDASNFLQAAPREQKEQALGALGVDIADLEEQQVAAYDDRRDVNRDLKNEKARQDAMAYDESWPDAEVDVVVVAGKLRELDWAHAKKANQARQEQQARNEAREVFGEIDEFRRRLEELEAELVECRKRAESLEWTEAQEAELRALGNQDDLSYSLGQANETNEKARQKVEYRQSRAQSEKLEAESQSYTEALEWIERQKVERLAAAKCPIEGLSFDDAGLRLNGVPFEQASQSERFRVVIALALAAKPKLRVVLFREASLYDEQNWADLKQTCREYDVQLWAEIVGDKDRRVTVLMNDGQATETQDDPF